MTSLIFDVIGKDHASKTFENIGKKAKGAETNLGKLKAVGAVAMAALAAGAVEFGKKSVDKFQEVGGETLKLKRIIGGTSAEVSRLRFAGEETGVSADKLSTGFGILSKHLSANDKAWQSLGVATKDAEGKTKPMAELIPQIADVFAKLPAGPQRTALAMNLFGRSGKDLLPFLSKGKAGLEELGAESDKFGNTLNDKDTAAVYKNVIAKRQLNAAVSGLEIQLGQHLVPAVTSVVSAITRTVVWFHNLSPAVKSVVGVVGALVAMIGTLIVVTKAWTAAQSVLDAVMLANPVGLVVAAIAALVVGLVIAYKSSATFRSVVQGAFNGVKAAGQFMWQGLKVAFKFIADTFLAVAGVIIHGAAAAFGWVPGLGGKLKSAARKFDTFRDQVNAALGGITTKLSINVAFHAQMDANIRKAMSLGGQLSATTARGAHGKTAFASGTNFAPGGVALVGERGPELVNLPRGSRVHTASETARMGGGDMTASAPLVIKMDSRTVWQGLVVFKHQSGKTSLGLA